MFERCARGAHNLAKQRENSWHGRTNFPGDAKVNLPSLTGEERKTLIKIINEYETGY